MKKPQKELEEKYTEFQILAQQAEQIQQQLQVLQQQTEELSQLSESLEALSDVEQDSSIWTSIGGGIYLPAKTIGKLDKVLIGVGANVYVKKEISASVDLVRNQAMHLGELSKHLEQTLQKIAKKMMEIQEYFQNLQESDVEQ